MCLSALFPSGLGALRSGYFFSIWGRAICALDASPHSPFGAGRSALWRSLRILPLRGLAHCAREVSPHSSFRGLAYCAREVSPHSSVFRGLAHWRSEPRMSLPLALRELVRLSVSVSPVLEERESSLWGPAGALRSGHLSTFFLSGPGTRRSLWRSLRILPFGGLALCALRSAPLDVSVPLTLREP